MRQVSEPARKEVASPCTCLDLLHPSAPPCRTQTSALPALPRAPLRLHTASRLQAAKAAVRQVSEPARKEVNSPWRLYLFVYLLAISTAVVVEGEHLA